MLANRRTEWLIGRDRNEMISMRMTSGRMRMGTPEGTNSFRKRMPFLAKPTASTVRNTSAASAAVTTMWLVTVKKPGIMPSMLQTKMNVKSVNTRGKYFIPVSRLRCCHVLPLVLVVRYLVSDPATGPDHDLLLHPLVSPHHVEDAGRKPQNEEQQEQPGGRAEPLVQAPTDGAPDDDRTHQLGRHAHAVGHAAPAHVGIEIGVRAGLALGLDLVQPPTQLGKPALERSRVLGARLAAARTSIIGWFRHRTNVLSGRR